MGCSLPCTIANPIRCKFPILRNSNGQIRSSLAFMISPAPKPPPLVGFGNGVHQRRRSNRIQVQCRRPLSPPDPDKSTPAEAENSTSTSSNAKTRLLVVSFAAITAVLSLANRVLYKLALVPMKDYPFFLAQLSTFGPCKGWGD